MLHQTDYEQSSDKGDRKKQNDVCLPISDYHRREADIDGLDRSTGKLTPKKKQSGNPDLSKKTKLHGFLLQPLFKLKNEKLHFR